MRSRHRPSVLFFFFMYSYTVQTGPRSPTGSVWVLYRYTPIVSWRHRSMFVFCWWLVKFAFLTNFIIISWVELKVWNALSLIAILVWKPVINIIIILNDFTNRRYTLLLLCFTIYFSICFWWDIVWVDVYFLFLPMFPFAQKVMKFGENVQCKTSLLESVLKWCTVLHISSVQLI